MKKFLTVFLIISILFTVFSVPVFAEEVISDEPVPVTDDDTIVNVLKTYFNDVGVIINDSVDDNYLLNLYTDYTLNNLNFIYQKGTDILFYLPNKFYDYLKNLSTPINSNCLIFYSGYQLLSIVYGVTMGGVSDYASGYVTGEIIDYDYYHNNSLISDTDLGKLIFLDGPSTLANTHYNAYEYIKINHLDGSKLWYDVININTGSIKSNYWYSNIPVNYNCYNIYDTKPNIDNNITDFPNSIDYDTNFNNHTNIFTSPNGSTYYNYITYNKPVVSVPVNPSPIVPPTYVPDISYTTDAFNYCKYTASQVYEVVHEGWTDEDYQQAYDDAYNSCVGSSDDLNATFENGALDTVFGILTLPYYLGKGLVALILSYDDVPKCLYLPKVDYQGVNMSDNLEFCFDDVLSEPKVSDFYLLYLNFVDVILYFGLATLFYRKVRAMLANTTAD